MQPTETMASTVARFAEHLEKGRARSLAGAALRHPRGAASLFAVALRVDHLPALIWPDPMGAA